MEALSCGHHSAQQGGRGRLAAAWNVIFTLRARASTVAFEESEGGGEETSCSEGEEDDGAAIGTLGCGWGGGGVVQALRAALGADWWGAQG